MEFVEEGEYIVSHWKPHLHFSGYKGILHGGIQATLMDEIAGWCVQVKLKTAGVTTQLATQFKKPVYVDQREIILKAHVVEHKRRLARVDVELFNAKKELCSTGTIDFFIFPENIAKEKLSFPEYSLFFQEPETKRG